MRGFVITLDMVLAIIVVTGILIGVSTVLGQISHEGMGLEIGVEGMLLSMEKGDIFESAISGDTEDMENILNTLPENICAEVFIYDRDGDLLLHRARVGCECSAKEKVRASRTFIIVDGGSMEEYWAEGIGCLR